MLVSENRLLVLPFSVSSPLREERMCVVLHYIPPSNRVALKQVTG